MLLKRLSCFIKNKISTIIERDMKQISVRLSLGSKSVSAGADKKKHV